MLSGAPLRVQHMKTSRTPGVECSAGVGPTYLMGRVK
jgi:hypothetical protein